MDRPEYLSKYMFDWELLDVIIGGRSALDTKYFIASLQNDDEVDNFLLNYGVDPMLRLRPSPLNSLSLWFIGGLDNRIKI